MNSVRLPAWFARAGLVSLLAMLPWAEPAMALPQTETPAGIPDLIATNQRSFEIPFTINTAQQDVVEVVLQMSVDRGKTWQEHSRRAPASSSFPFSSREDQEFWFAIQTVDRNGQRYPSRQALRPELRIAVDTVKPTMEFQVRPDAAGRIVGSWNALDQNIDPCSMVIQYRSADAPDSEPWFTVPAQTCRKNVTSRFRDELAFWPQEVVGNLSVRAQIKDLAGNMETVERGIAMPMGAGVVAPSPVANPLRSGMQAATQPADQSTQQLNTNYLRSRVPYALADQYGVAGEGGKASANPPSASQQTPRTASPQELHRNQLRDQSRNATTQPAQTAALSSQNDRPSERLPQPPVSRANRFASNSPTTRLPERPGTQWNSRTSDESQSQTAKASTDSWPAGGQPMSDPVSQVAQVPSGNQPYYNPVPAASTATPAPQQASPALPPGAASQAVAPTTQQQSGAPLIPQQAGLQHPPQAVAAGGQNPTPSTQAQWISSTTGDNQQAPPTPSTVLVSGPKMESLRRSSHGSNSLRFQLEYDVDAIGPEGVQAVELWMTRDGGNTWRRTTVDEDRRSPVDVEVDSEGIYGFRILVISNEGLRARQPRSGDPADMWVNVDTTLPKVQITGVPYGRGAEAGSLLVQWNAVDVNLQMRPVKLSWSAAPHGPWTTVEDGIRNQGQYAWKPGADIPDQVYLKLEARDTAGNTGVHQLNRPVDVSGLIPRGHIRGLTPLREPPVPAGDTST